MTSIASSKIQELFELARESMNHNPVDSLLKFETCFELLKSANSKNKQQFDLVVIPAAALVFKLFRESPEDITLLVLSKRVLEMLHECSKNPQRDYYVEKLLYVQIDVYASAQLYPLCVKKLNILKEFQLKRSSFDLLKTLLRLTTVYSQLEDYSLMEKTSKEIFQFLPTFTMDKDNENYENAFYTASSLHNLGVSFENLNKGSDSYLALKTSVEVAKFAKLSEQIVDLLESDYLAFENKLHDASKESFNTKYEEFKTNEDDFPANIIDYLINNKKSKKKPVKSLNYSNLSNNTQSIKTNPFDTSPVKNIPSFMNVGSFERLEPLKNKEITKRNLKSAKSRTRPRTATTLRKYDEPGNDLFDRSLITPRNRNVKQVSYSDDESD
eukprot:TRINITY_DN855_c0_g1_i1.p1 TRINITY_DN855_c0_g1~~TRINITY_DN855_c0_g1_i1.p1  ORF type:complete len:384 (-),score=102.35 TRINITY_DN855_c0_g1_i1:192-1343(-)